MNYLRLLIYLRLLMNYLRLLLKNRVFWRLLLVIHMLDFLWLLLLVTIRNFKWIKISKFIIYWSLKCLFLNLFLRWLLAKTFRILTKIIKTKPKILLLLYWLLSKLAKVVKIRFNNILLWLVKCLLMGF